MTQPNEYLPDSAANYGSLAAWAAKSQEDWEAEQRNPETARWGGILTGFFDGLPGGQSYTLTLLSTLAIRMLGLDPTTFFAGVQDCLDAINSWMSDLQDMADQSALDLADLIDGVLGTGNQVEDLVSFLIQSRDDINETWERFWAAVFGTSGAGAGLTDWSTASSVLASIAATAKANSDSAMLQLATIIDNVLGTGHSAHDLATFIIDSTNWLARLITDVLILLDVFHLIYPTGASGDAPDRTIGGKRTWYSAWNDLKVIFGLAKNAATPTDVAPMIGESINAAQQTATTAGSNAGLAIAGNQALANAVTSGAQGALDGDADAAMAESAVADLRGSLSGLQGQVSELLAGSGGPAGGVKFTGQQPGWQPGGGTNWDIYGNGSPAVVMTGVYGWTKTGAGKYIHAIYKAKKLTSAQQSASMVFYSAPAYPNGFDPKTYGGSNLLIIRAKADGSWFPFCQIWQNKAQFGYWNGSTRTLLGSPFAVSGTASGGFTLQQVDGNNPYKFDLVSNGVVIASYTYTSTQAPYGSQYLSVGMGMVSGTGNLGDEFAPGSILQFSAKDAGAGAGLISSGIGARMIRLSTVGSSIGANANSTLPYEFFNQIDWLSAGIRRMPSDAGSDGFVFDEGGLYACHANFKKSNTSALGGASFWYGALGARTYYGWQGGQSGDYISGFGIVPIEAGQTISPTAINLSGSAFNVLGGPTGDICYFSVAKVG